MRDAIAATGLLNPVDYMLAIMRNEQLDLSTRLDAAKAVAPYTNPRLASIDATVRSTTEVTLLSDEERRQRARAAILAAFAERPQPVIEGKFQVIAGRAVETTNERQSVGNDMGSGKALDAIPLEENDE